MLNAVVLKAGILLAIAMQQVPASAVMNYRMVGKEKYQVVDSSGFFIYSKRKLVQGEKIARPETVFYFSIDSQGPLRELTRANLEDVFASNAKFRYALEQTFRSDKQLLEYDRYLKMYKIKYLYNQSLQE
ncbi:MAG TPA: hypothetical protein VHE34_06875 [Puia sp.]|uniref:hypothetical protein n=1 Tax=Puia sp. TaxID=2045100 RepID=UPI002CFD3E24|nr:hypothetical protein [Puia sp.]HVU94930.1 hypothetical protein [Puia sp.]